MSEPEVECQHKSMQLITGRCMQCRIPWKDVVRSCPHDGGWNRFGKCNKCFIKDKPEEKSNVEDC